MIDRLYHAHGFQVTICKPLSNWFFDLTQITLTPLIYTNISNKTQNPRQISGPFDGSQKYLSIRSHKFPTIAFFNLQSCEMLPKRGPVSTNQRRDRKTGSDMAGKTGSVRLCRFFCYYSRSMSGSPCAGAPSVYGPGKELIFPLSHATERPWKRWDFDRFVVHFLTSPHRLCLGSRVAAARALVRSVRC